MRGSPKVLLSLNEALREELKSIAQYNLHARMQKNWGYKKLAKETKERFEDEECHAKRLIKRILLLEGTPDVTSPMKLKVGADVKAQMQNDCDSEDAMLDLYNRLIPVCRDENDDTSRRILEHILQDEEEHYHYTEQEVGIIKSIGLPAYLETKL
jgi:bacterioferritin